MINKANLCQRYLDHLYKNISGQTLNKKHKASISETYGEILFESIQKIFSQLTLSTQDIFVDLGSGLGKVVSQVFLQFEVKSAHGIEILPELHQHALRAAQQMQIDLPEFFSEGRKLEFQHGDFLKISFDHATVVLISSPLFTPKQLILLGNTIEKNTKINKVITLRPILSLTRLSISKVMRIEGSWDSALCYLYS